MNLERNYYFEKARGPFEMEWKLYPDRLNIKYSHLKNLLPGPYQAET